VKKTKCKKIAEDEREFGFTPMPKKERRRGRRRRRREVWRKRGEESCKLVSSEAADELEAEAQESSRKQEKAEVRGNSQAQQRA
jgi:hypothetical protein